MPEHSDLAGLYGVSTKRLNERVKRNYRRFPSGFVFRLSARESKSLRSQIATSNLRRGGRLYLPYVFSEHGAVMAASVLNSAKAIHASVYVVRAFVRLREGLGMHKELARKLTELEKRMEGHDEDITALFGPIRQLIAPPERALKRIGFRT